MRAKHERLLIGLQSEIAEALSAAGVSERSAASTAARAVHRWCANFGGVTVYLPRGQTEWRAERDARIVAEFNGANAGDLALRYDLSESRVRQVVRLHRCTGASRNRRLSGSARSRP